ncbi:hypothetical protein [Natranaerofaba carboxydovora]|uniref:hypothetical protein n=1 Tax=Natranaerofaba carboxydovora TaxID=2742683 RepID=UPI001F141486|nr:hypothetical protein [Natranaerofaba carboxydovora]UMZ72699.1 hypothetical protein ACONDI_00225 [Natranaerofaba carboxydovora]
MMRKDGESLEGLKVKFFNNHFATSSKLEKEVNEFIESSVETLYGIETNFYNDEILISVYYK